MSLDVYLSDPTSTYDTSYLYERNITHNLTQMASKADIYKHLWRPEEIGITRAEQLIEPLTYALESLEATPKYFKQFNPENGWGSYDGFIEFIESYLSACKEYPKAKIETRK